MANHLAATTTIFIVRMGATTRLQAMTGQVSSPKCLGRPQVSWEKCNVSVRLQTWLRTWQKHTIMM
eukprot:8625329-Karenia_brevis.AAC.1